MSCHLAWQHRHDQDGFLHGGFDLWYLPCPESWCSDAFAIAHGRRVGGDKGLSPATIHVASFATGVSMTLALASQGGDSSIGFWPELEVGRILGS